VILLILCLLPHFAGTALKAGEPPPGPPWETGYWTARREALRTGTPVFIYFTKTY
jgi:hypothetical protein